MKTIRILVLLLFQLLCFLNINSQNPFNKGVNLTGWFQANSVYQIQFTKYTYKDFQNIKSLGCDVIRLPINLHYMTDGAPNYIINPVLYNFLDSVITWAESLNINLILDNHTFDPNVNTDATVITPLTKVWTQIAKKYKDRSNLIFYEILNEPHGISTADWGNIQKTVIDSIRVYDMKHTIIVGGSGYNSYNELQNLPAYTDDNLIYTFHFYDPFLFTHQGASWTSPSLAPLKNVPFPYNADSMPECPTALKGTWVENALSSSYKNDGTVDKIKQLIDVAIQFRNQKNVKIFCGEFGVYMLNARDTDRTYWYKQVREYFEANDIPWTIWDYQGDFGLFKYGSNELFDYDLNISLLNSLGLNIPSQEEFVIKPDSVGFNLYTDFIGVNCFEKSYSNVPINFYSSDSPNNNKYCISWPGPSQYQAIVLDFKPNKDLKYLVDNNYALDFMVRANGNNVSFHVRFVDTKINTEDHPWRMHYVVDNKLFQSDGRWYHVRIPLSSFTEQGSWDGSWFNPEGKFDWTAVDKFEISAETNLTGTRLWFDNIMVSDKDTAKIYDTTITITTGVKDISFAKNGYGVKIYPQPMRDVINVEIVVNEIKDINIEIIDLFGRIIHNEKLKSQSNKVLYSWNGKDINGNNTNAGIYFIRISVDHSFKTYKIIKRY